VDDSASMRRIKEDTLQAVEAGVPGSILKPVTPQLLKEKIDQILSMATGFA